MNCRQIPVGSVLLAGLLVLQAGALPAQNPRGFLESSLWAALLPLSGNDCTGGGEEILLENWVAPHDVAAESPVVGTNWGDIDFGGQARSAGYLGGGSVRFRTLRAGPDPDAVDFGADLASRGLPRDFVLAIAVTYLRNNTDGPLPVGVCTSSDDSIQVWVNNSRILNHSVCRALDAECSEVSPAVLAPGTNRIMVLVWQGHGGFAFRLGLLRPDGTFYTGDDTEIEYLGARSPAGAPAEVPLLTRSYAGDVFLRPAPSHLVTLRGNGLYDPGTIYRVCERLQGPITPLGISDISAGGEATVYRDLPQAGDFFYTVVGAPCSRDNSTSLGAGVYTTRARTDADIGLQGDTFEFAFVFATGDFDLAVEILDRRLPLPGGNGKFGLMARQSLDDTSRFGQLQDEGTWPDRPARYARRRSHLEPLDYDEPATTDGLEDPNDASPLDHPRFQRLTRRGDTITAWVSESAGLAGRDPEVDANWAVVFSEVWTDAPASLYVGFAGTVPTSDGCQPGEIDWSPVTRRLDTIPPPPTGTEVCWEAQGTTLDQGRLRYRVTASRGSVIRVEGEAGPSRTAGPELLLFQDEGTTDTGILDYSHDIGAGGPCTPGALEWDDRGTPLPADDTYRIRASGEDIWANGDQFHFAYREVQGDFTIEARFSDVQHPPRGGRWGKYGLMARRDCRPDSAYFLVHDCAATNYRCEIDAPRTAFRPLSGVEGGNVEPNRVWWQDTLGEEPLAACDPPVNPDPRANDMRGDSRNIAPYLRLVRRRNSFYGYGSNDGEDWRILGAFSWVDVPDTLLVGIAATSHAESSVNCESVDLAFDRMVFDTPPSIPGEIADPEDEAGTVKESSDFDSPDGTCPPGWKCSGWGSGAFRPQVVAGRLRLADLRGSSRGSGEDTATTAFLTTPVGASAAYLFDFDVHFRYDRAAAGDGNPPADGLTFCMLGTRTGAEQLSLRLGDRGSALGYSQINVSQDERAFRSVDASLNSFAVEFDVWHSGEVGNEGDGANVSGWDPSGGAGGQGTGQYHIGLDVNASVASVQRNQQVGVQDEDLPDIFAPDGIHVRVLYDHGRVRVWVRANPPQPGNGDLTLVLDQGIEPLAWNVSEALVGFTAGTGDATCIMEVDNFVMQELQADAEPLFHRGDADSDGAMNITDGIYILNFLFLGGAALSCQEAANANDDSSVDITDGIYVLNFLFLGGPPPLDPGPPGDPCGPDPRTSDSDLGCESYPPCE